MVRKLKKPAKGVRHSQRREAKTKPQGVHRPTRKEIGAKASKPADQVEAAKGRRFKINEMMVARARQRKVEAIPAFTFDAYKPAPGVIPAGKEKLAMDSAFCNEGLVSWANQGLYGGMGGSGMPFLGYPYLSEMAQRPEFRRISEVISTEMTRKWIKFQSTEEEAEVEEDVDGEEVDPSLPPGAKKPTDGKPGDKPAGKEKGDKPAPTFDEVRREEEIEAPVDNGREIENPDANGVDLVNEDPEEGTTALGTELDDDVAAAQAAAGENPDALEATEGQNPDDINVEQEQILPEVEGAANEIDETESSAVENNDPSTAAPKSDKAKKIKELEDAMKLLDVQEIFRKLALQDGFFGRSHLYLDTGDTLNREELRMPIGDGRSKLSSAKVSSERPLLRIATVEPIWCYPSNYNSDDPLRPDWYKPDMWFVQGKEIHSSRLLTFVGREVPDLVKPAFAFGGLSMTQMAKPYVDNWLRVRQSVSELIWSFSVSGLATKMEETLTPGGDDLFRRADLFDAVRDNRGLMLIDKETEEFFNVSTPLGTLDTLQAQAQEHMASVCGIPLVKLLGIQPAGLNASSEGEIRTFYDWIGAYQEHFFRPNLTKVVDFIMLSLWGEIDEEITFVFNPLWSLDDKALADVAKTKMDTETGYINAGVLHPEEVRKKLADDPDSGYTDIDPDNMPEDPMDKAMAQGLNPVTGEPMNAPGEEGEEDGEDGPPGPSKPPNNGKGPGAIPPAKKKAGAIPGAQ